jgi:uncharacterized protein (TIGR03663 family)
VLRVSKPVRRRSLGRAVAALRARPRAELAVYAALVALALALRLIALGDRPFHHDESQDAYFSWTFFTSGDYHYDPLLHGPLRFYLTAAVYTVFGDSDFTARLAPALMGTAMVALPYFLREQLGRVAALAASVLLAVGPSYLYFSRFAREDIYIAAITLAMLVVTFRFLDRPRRRQPPLIGGLLALSFATKESTFITLFVAGTFFAAALAWQVRAVRRAQGAWRDAPLVRTVASVGWEAWAWALVAFLGVYTVLFTTFLTHPSGVYGLYTGLEYWLGQQPVGRGGEPWFFYAVVLFAHEWPALLFGAIGAVVAVRRPTLLRLFLVWAFVLSLAVYSWAGEKFAWLALHPLLPLLLLAGIGVQAVWDARSRTSRAAGIAALALAFAYVGYASFLVNAEHSADPREFLVSTQSAPDVVGVRDEVLALARRQERRGRPLRVTVDAAQGATFPWAWYFRDLGTAYVDLSAGGAPPDADVLLLTEASRERLQPNLVGYDGRRFRFRVWWVREYGRQSPGGWARWFLERRPWNPTGGLSEWLYVRRVVAES